MKMNINIPNEINDLDFNKLKVIESIQSITDIDILTLGHLCDIDIKDISKLNDSQISSLTSQLFHNILVIKNKLLQPQKLSRYIKIGYHICKIKKFDDEHHMTFSDFVDIEYYIKHNQYEKAITYLLSNIFIIKEEYIKKHIKFETLLNIMSYYYKYINDIKNSYEGLFKTIERNDDEEIDIDDESFGDRWGWFGVIVELADQFKMDLDDITDWPIRKVFNTMSYNKEKQDHINEQERKRRIT